MRHTTGPRRAAFSLIDLLVLLTLIAIVVGLMLPMVQVSREAAVRVQCADNLKKIGVAMQKYADVNQGRLPTIGGGDTGHDTVFVCLLPYIGETELHKKLKATGQSWYAAANADFIKTRLSVYQCPAAPKPERILEGTMAETTYLGAPTDYNCINNITGAVKYLFPADMDLTAPIQSNIHRKMGEITDGLSNTFFGVVEIADKPNRWRAGMHSSVESGKGGSGTWAGNTFNSPRGYTFDGLTAPGPCPMNCANTAAVFSFHPEGCNFVFADGSVRFLPKNMNVWIYYALITRAGGEVISTSDF